MKTKHLQTILVLSRAAATAVRRLVFRLCTLIWKAALLFFITMAVALTALAFNAAFFVYRKLADRWAATVRRFFETYFYAELRERCSALEGRFDLVHGQIGRLKEELEGAARTQAAVEERTAQRLELLKQAMAEGNALLEKIASKEEEATALNGFVGNIHHHHHHHHHQNKDQDQQQQFSPVSFDSGTSVATEDRHHLQLLTPPPPSNLEMFSSFPVDSILSHLNSNVGDGISGQRSGSRGSCAFYGGSEEEEESCGSLSPPGRPPSNLCRPSSSPPPPPPPPPPPSMFAPATFGKVSFKSTSQQQQQKSTEIKASKFVVSESEIAAMRNKLKKVPAKPNQNEKEDS